MKLLTLLKTEFTKQKMGVLWLMVVGIPFGTTGLMLFDMFIRYDSWLYDLSRQRGLSSWEILLEENHRTLGFGMFLPIFIAVIATIVHYVEVDGDNWKKLLTLPVFRGHIYISKFLTITVFSFVMIALNGAGLILVGKIMDFPDPVNFSLFGSYVVNQCGAILGVAALHNFLSANSKNVVKPVIISFLAMIITPGIISKSEMLGKLIPYSYTYHADGLRGIDAVNGAVYGVVFMVIMSIIGIIHFSKKDMI